MRNEQYYKDKAEKKAFHQAKKEARLNRQPFYEHVIIAPEKYAAWLAQFPKARRTAMIEKVPAHLRNKRGTNNPTYPSSLTNKSK